MRYISHLPYKSVGAPRELMPAHAEVGVLPFQAQTHATRLLSLRRLVLHSPFKSMFEKMSSAMDAVMESLRGEPALLAWVYYLPKGQPTE